MALSRRLLRRAAVAAASLACAFVVGELALRAVLFGGFEAGWSLRDPARYTDFQSDEDWSKLRMRWRGAQTSVPPGRYHPVLGWVPRDVDHESLEHARADGVGDRRPVLLYGDSYALGTSPAGTRFEDVLDASSLGATHALLNHGAAGYGLDQVTLMLEATVDRYADADPLVLVGVFVDDDLDRCVLRLRGLPKPRFVLGDGGLELVGVPVPSVEAYLERHPLAIRSYMARLLVHGAPVPASWRARLTGAAALRREKAALGAALLRRVAAELRARDLDFAFVVFEGERRTAAEREVRDWRLATVLDTLAELDATFVRTRAVLRAHAARTGRPIADLFDHGGERADHFDAEGNAVAFEALAAAIEGRCADAR